MTGEEYLIKLSRIKKNTIIVSILSDIIEGNMVDIQKDMADIGNYEYEDKYIINKLSKNSKLLREKIDRRYKDTPEMIEKFGEISDLLKGAIKDILE